MASLACAFPILPDKTEAWQAFDRWFKAALAELTGADLNTPSSAPLSELLSDYHA